MPITCSLPIIRGPAWLLILFLSPGCSTEDARVAPGPTRDAGTGGALASGGTSAGGAPGSGGGSASGGSASGGSASAGGGTSSGGAGAAGDDGGPATPDGSAGRDSGVGTPDAALGPTVQIQLRVVDADTQAPVEGAEVCAYEGLAPIDACTRAHCDPALAVLPCATSDAAGTATVRVPAGTDLTVIVQHAGYQGGAYPYRVPVWDPQPFDAWIFTEASTQAWYAGFGATYDPDLAELALSMTGPGGTHLDGVSAELVPASGTVWYGTGGGNVDAALTATSSAGWAAATGVTPGDVSVRYSHATLQCVTIPVLNLGWLASEQTAVRGLALPGFVTRLEMRCQ